MKCSYVITLLMITLVALSSLAQIPILSEESTTNTENEEQQATKVMLLASLYINSTKRLLNYLNNITSGMNITGTKVEELTTNATALLDKAITAYNAGNYSQALEYAKTACALLRHAYREVLRHSERIRKALQKGLEVANRTGVIQRAIALRHFIMTFVHKVGSLNETIRQEINQTIQQALSGNITWGEARSRIANILNQVRKEYRQRVLERMVKERILRYLWRRYNKTIMPIVIKGFHNMTINITRNVIAYKFAIQYIATTMKHLELLKKKLIELNASETAVLALDRAIANLNVTLNTLMSMFNNSGKIWPTKKALTKINVEKLRAQIASLEKKVDEIEKLIEKYEDQNPWIVNHLKKLLNGIKELLNSAKHDLKNGKILLAQMKVAKANNMLRHIEHFLLKYLSKHSKSASGKKGGP